MTQLTIAPEEEEQSVGLSQTFELFCPSFFFLSRVNLLTHVVDRSFGIVIQMRVGIDHLHPFIGELLRHVLPPRLRFHISNQILGRGIDKGTVKLLFKILLVSFNLPGGRQRFEGQGMSGSGKSLLWLL